MEYDVLAFIGRFQPMHMGHKAVVDTALERAKKVAVVIGSDQQPRTARNPFTTAERVEMFSLVYPQEVADGRIHFAPQVDHTYSIDRWRMGIQSSVMQIANTPFTPDPVRTGLIGHSKDHSSFYLKSFPTWDPIQVPNFNNLDATTIRRGYFADGMIDRERWMLPDVVRDWLDDWKKSDGYEQVREEQTHLLEFAQQWAGSPYPPVFYTADAVVVQSGHILLVKRGAQPGKGLWALPGGYVNRYESPRQAAIRELKEETRIALQPEVLDRCISSWRVFDDPYRSQRGRTVTTAFKVDLRDSEKLPKIKGGDDAEKARWVPLAQLNRSAMFEDHYDIIEAMASI